MTTKQWLIIGAGAAALTGLYFLVTRKNTLSNTGASDTPVVTNLPGGGQTIQQPANGNQAYTNQANVIVRSSPEIDNPTLGIFGGNVNDTIEVSGTWLGTVVATLPDSNGDTNPANGQVYQWFQVVLSATLQKSFSLPAGTIEYVRQDMVTIK